MASMKKKKGMVFHQEWATTAAGDHPLACFAPPKSGITSKDGMHPSPLAACEEEDTMAKAIMHPSNKTIGTHAGLAASKHPANPNLQSENLSPDSVCKGVRVTLENNSMWNEFYRCQTEMILTKQGSRMFPYCRFRISGLEPSRNYSLIMDIQSLDSNHYEWTGRSWQVAGKAECPVKCQPFTHPDSPSTGQHWTQSPVSFYKLKLTNNPADQEGNTVLRPLHRYIPRLHVVPADKAVEDIKLNGPDVFTFTFAQTEFIAVTSYQNSQFAQLKVDYNPFMKGLKEDGNSWNLKLKAGKDFCKDGGTSANEQRTLRKSLKSLLTNHKLRSSRRTDVKPLVSEEKYSTTNKVQSPARVPEDGHPRPVQKLFSELIREAHVSLERCNLEQLGGNTSPSHRNEEKSSQTAVLKSSGLDVSRREDNSVKRQSETSPEQVGEPVATLKKVKDLPNPPKCKDVGRVNHSEVSRVVAAPVVSQKSADLNYQHDAELQPEETVKQHKRPAPLPLPALALFLKQHSTKSKKTNTKPVSHPPAPPPSESLSETVRPPEDKHITEPDEHKRHTGAQIRLQERVQNLSGPGHETTSHPSGLSCPKETRSPNLLVSISAAEAAVPDDGPLLPSANEECCSSGKSTISSTPVTSCLSPISSPVQGTVVPASETQQTPATSDSSTQPSDSSTVKSLPPPESFGFRSISASSSPEPLPSLPSSVVLQLDSVTSQSKDSSTSVFKWHTVLPPSEHYANNSLTFQATTQTLATSSLLPSQSPDPQTFDTSTPPPDPVPSFQENDQSLPFPAEFSPLALQLSLSPTFSSLDGDGLSPTPSLADLVHFFSNDDLGMGLDFSNAEPVAVPCPSPNAAKDQAHDTSQQVQPVVDNKQYKRKKSRRQNVAKTDKDHKTEEVTYTSMKPNLEEVEEQLFVSFTSKQALQLHLGDSEEQVLQTQETPDVQVGETAGTPETDKVLDIGSSSLSDEICPLKFPSKLWHLVNDTENSSICWDTSSDAIIIDQIAFEREVLSQGSFCSDTYSFKTFTSFVHQLHELGFKKISPAAKYGLQATASRATCHQFHNPNFKRNHPELVACMKTSNEKTKRKSGSKLNSPHRNQRVSTHSNERNRKKAETLENLEEKISSFEEILLRDLKLMRHRQVIHPVLQEVGLKMYLLDPTLAIDLQYLGVCLPIPAPGAPVDLHQSQAACSAFVSRTGKTTDVTKIKGWREKFTPPEAPPTPAPLKPEAGPGSDLQKKNLSAFCSDMLDEYLENEGKLIDERASSFSQPAMEPLVYELPTRSTSYVRTLDSVLQKQTGSTTSDLIYGFIPPSKRPKLTLKETKTSKRETTKQRAPKHNRSSPEPTTGPGDSNLIPTHPAVQTLEPVPSEPPITKKRRRRRLKHKATSQTLSLPTTTAPPSNATEEMAPLESDSELKATDNQNTSTRREGRASTVTQKGRETPLMTRALLRQRDLEDGVVWEGQPKTSITEERASIALTSLFTLKGFVRENPTAPIQLACRLAPPCLNEFCRMGCICSSLAYCSRISHCGQPACMLGCSCLKQKVVLLKNLDGSDSSPSRHCSNSNRKRKRKRRMKMAYVLKEADSVSQPADRVRTLWKRDNSDPDPVHVPKPAALRHHILKAEKCSSCARVRTYCGKNRIRGNKQMQKKSKPKHLTSVSHRDPAPSERKTKTRTSPGPPDERSHVTPPDCLPHLTPPEEPQPKPSKRLIILAECVWASDADRGHVLMKLCERMASDQLDQPFWVKKYLISPIAQTTEGCGADHCIQYKIHISTPKIEPEKPSEAVTSSQQGGPTESKQLQNVFKEPDHLTRTSQATVEEEEVAVPFDDWQREVEDEEAEPPDDCHRQVDEEEAEPPDDWQKQVDEEEAEHSDDWQKRVDKEETEPPDDWQRQVDEEEKVEPLDDWQQQENEEEVESPDDWQRQVDEQEAEPPDDWQRQVDEEEAEPPDDWQQQVDEEEAEPSEEDQQTVDFDITKRKTGSTNKVLGGGSGIRHEVKKRLKTKYGRRMADMGLPFLTGICPAGFLSANRKQLGGTDHVIKVNGKFYPLAKIQLGKMGALHPANRLAAYLTGRVGSNKRQTASSSSELWKPPQTQSPSLTSNPPPSCEPAVKLLTVPKTTAVIQAAASANKHACEAPKEAGSQVVKKVKVYPGSTSSGQKMVLHAVKSLSGVQYYRRPDGQLYRLFPLSQLRRISQKQPSQTGSSSPVLPVVVHQTIISKKHPVTSVNTSTPPNIKTTSSCSSTVLKYSTTTSSSTCTMTTSSSSLSALSVLPVPLSVLPPLSLLTQKSVATTKIIPTYSSSISSLSSPVVSFPGLHTQEGTYTFSVLPPTSRMDHVVVQCNESPNTLTTTMVTAPSSSSPLQPHPSTPPSTVQSITSAIHLGPENLLVKEVPPAPPRPAVSEVSSFPAPTPSAGQTSSDPQVSHKLLDQNSMCVDDEIGLYSAETGEDARWSVEVAKEGKLSSSETDSDFEDSENDGETKRLNHNMMARLHRAKIKQLFDALRREVGCSEPSVSKSTTLQKAVSMIQDLTKAESILRRKKRRLLNRRDSLMDTVAPTGGSKDTEVTSVVLLDDLDEAADDVDEVPDDTPNPEKVIAKASNGENEDNGQLEADPARQGNITGSLDSRTSLSMKMNRTISSAFRDLSSVMKDQTSSKLLLVEKAHQEIQKLQGEDHRMRSQKICLKQQRNSYIKYISQMSGKSEKSILQKMEELLFKEQMIEQDTANQLPAAAGGTCNPCVTITSASQPQDNPQAPPTPVSASPVNTCVQTGSLRVLPRSLAPPAAPSVPSNRLRTVPNILSRSKKQAVNPSRNSVDVSFPAQQVLTRSPVMAGTVPSVGAGVFNVTLSGSNVNKPQTQFTSMPLPPAGMIYSNSSAVTMNELTENYNNTLVQSTSTTQPEQEEDVPVGPSPSSPPLVSVGSDQSTEQIREMDHPSDSSSSSSSRGSSAPGSDTGLQTEVSVGGPPGSDTGLQEEVSVGGPPGSDTGLQEEVCVGGPPGSDTGLQEEVCVGGPPWSDTGLQEEVSVGGLLGSDTGLQEEASAGGPLGSNTGLQEEVSAGGPLGSNTGLQEEVSAGGPLGSNTGLQEEVSVGGPPESDTGLQEDVRVGGQPGSEEICKDSLTSLLNEIVFLNQKTGTVEQQGEEPDHKSSLLQQDSDEAVNLDMVEVKHNDPTSQSRSVPRTSNKNRTGDILAPPPLLQMKVGGVKVVEATSRPMPRLVPLGLRGNPPS